MTETQDVKDMFEAIAFIEQKIFDEGFQEGFEKGTEDGRREGLHSGYHKGSEVGFEIGYYKGCVTAIQQKNIGGESDKVQTLVKKLIEMLNAFPRENTADVDLNGELIAIRSQMKRLGAIVKTDFLMPFELPQFSF